MLVNKHHRWGRDIVVHLIKNVHINTSLIKMPREHDFSPYIFFFYHAGHEHSVLDPVSLSFRKWGVWYDRETKLMSIFMSLSPLFHLLNLYVMFPCPCNIKRFITINLNSCTALNYVRAWRNNFHAETIQFQDLPWNFSFQAVLVRLHWNLQYYRQIPRRITTISKFLAQDNDFPAFWLVP